MSQDTDFVGFFDEETGEVLEVSAEVIPLRGAPRPLDPPHGGSAPGTPQEMTVKPLSPKTLARILELYNFTARTLWQSIPQIIRQNSRSLTYKDLYNEFRRWKKENHKNATVKEIVPAIWGRAVADVWHEYNKMTSGQKQNLKPWKDWNSISLPIGHTIKVNSGFICWDKTYIGKCSTPVTYKTKEARVIISQDGPQFSLEVRV